MNEKTTMQQLIEYCEILDKKHLPEYTMAVAIYKKAIELLEIEKEQINNVKIPSAAMVYEHIRQRKKNPHNDAGFLDGVYYMIQLIQKQNKYFNQNENTL